MAKSFEVYDAASGKFVPLSIGPMIDARAMLTFSRSTLSGSASVPPPAPSPAAPQFSFPSQASGPSSGSSAVPVAALGHLHYGGSFSSKTQKLGSKPEKGRTFRQQKRMELMVQLENAAVPDHMAAAMLCLSVNRYKTIKKSADYLRVRMRLTHGIIVDHESRLADIKEQRKEVLTQLLPAALQVIATAVQTPANTLAEKRHQVAVAQDILDREGSLAKISRSEVKPVDGFDWGAVDENNRSIIDVIRGSAKRSIKMTLQHEVEDTLELSRAFSNSKTLDPTQQQAALDQLERELLTELPMLTERPQ